MKFTDLLSLPIETLMSNANIYSKVTRTLRGNDQTKEFVTKYVKPKDGDVILDIGCGPGDALMYMPKVWYHGFDMDSSYIEMARERYKNDPRVIRIMNENVCRASIMGSGYDIAIAMGVIHHLDDYDARKLFQLAYYALKPGGRLVTYDGVYLPNQSIAEKFFLDIDRGKHIRTTEDYWKLIDGHFDPSVDIRHDLLKIPYATIIFTCVK